MPSERAAYVGRRLVTLAHVSMSGQFQQGRPLTVHFGSGRSLR